MQLLLSLSASHYNYQHHHRHCHDHDDLHSHDLVIIIFKISWLVYTSKIGSSVNVRKWWYFQHSCRLWNKNKTVQSKLIVVFSHVTDFILKLDHWQVEKTNQDLLPGWRKNYPILLPHVIFSGEIKASLRLIFEKGMRFYGMRVLSYIYNYYYIFFIKEIQCLMAVSWGNTDELQMYWTFINFPIEIRSHGSKPGQRRRCHSEIKLH